MTSLARSLASTVRPATDVLSSAQLTLMLDKLEQLHGELIPVTALQSYIDKEETVYNSRYCIIDTETTGLHTTSSVVSVAVLVMVKGVVVETFYSLINPFVPIPFESSLIHKITDEDVKNSPCLSEVMPKINGMIKGCVAIVAHNGAFDRDRLKGLVVKPWIDTLTLSRSLHKELKCHRLEALVQSYGLKINNTEGLPAHHALYDTRVAGELFMFLMREMVAKGVMPVKVEEIKGYSVAKVVKTCSFGKYKGELWKDIPTGYLKWMDIEYDGKRDMLESARWHLKLRAT